MPISSDDAQTADLVARFDHVFISEPELAGLSEAARRVLSIAAALYFERGSASTSMRDLARACGLTPGALYNHFDSRDDLLYVLVRTGHTRAQRDLVAALGNGEDTPTNQLRSFIVAYTELHLRFPAFSQLIHREYVHLSPARKAEIVEQRRQLRDLLVLQLRRGADDGSFDLVGGSGAAVGTATMLFDMCSRTSEWFNPRRSSSRLSARYAAAALRLVGATQA